MQWPCGGTNGELATRNQSDPCKRMSRRSAGYAPPHCSWPKPEAGMGMHGWLTVDVLYIHDDLRTCSSEGFRAPMRRRL
jgi:hypothetical protein